MYETWRWEPGNQETHIDSLEKALIFLLWMMQEAVG